MNNYLKSILWENICNIRLWQYGPVWVRGHLHLPSLHRPPFRHGLRHFLLRLRHFLPVYPILHMHTPGFVQIELGMQPPAQIAAKINHTVHKCIISCKILYFKSLNIYLYPVPWNMMHIFKVSRRKKILSFYLFNYPIN